MKARGLGLRHWSDVSPSRRFSPLSSHSVLPEASRENLGTADIQELWRFSWPIMLMQTAESGIAFIMNFFLGRLPRPELAIAAFGVLDGLIRVLLSPLRNLIHTTQALVKNRADARVVIIFSLHAAIFFGAIMLCFNIPIVRDFVLYNLMGLTTEMADAVTPALQLSAILRCAWLRAASRAAC